MIECECFVQGDMGVHGEAYVAMVSYSAMNGKPEADITYGDIARNRCGY